MALWWPHSSGTLRDQSWDYNYNLERAELSGGRGSVGHSFAALMDGNHIQRPLARAKDPGVWRQNIQTAGWVTSWSQVGYDAWNRKREGSGTPQRQLGKEPRKTTHLWLPLYRPELSWNVITHIYHFIFLHFIFLIWKMREVVLESLQFFLSNVSYLDVDFAL